MAFRRLLFALLACASCCAQAQVPPDWWEPASRKMHYPPSEWYVGFATGEQQPGETIERTFARLKDEARVEAASTVRMSVEKDMVSVNRSELMQSSSQFDERVTEVFQSTTHMNVELELAGLHVEVWQQPKTKEIGAFAYVSHKELQRKTERKITATMTKIAMSLDGVDQMVRAGQKMKARDAAIQVLELFAELEQTQRLLLAITDDDEALELDETHALQQRMLATISGLSHATVFYIQCQATVDGEQYTLFDKEIRGFLSEKGCQFTSEREDADWVIDVNAGVIKTEHREGMPWFAYVDGSLTVYKGGTGENVLADRLSSLETGHPDGIKGGEFKLDKAARMAYSNAARIIANAIIKLAQE